MEQEEQENDQQHNLTDFGKLLRSERTLKGDKNAKKMADTLGISEGLLSGIENGNKEDYPDMDFLIRCVDYFGWRLLANDAEEEKRKKIEKTLDLFEKGFLSTENISLNMKYFQNQRKDMLIQIIVMLLFIPDMILGKSHDKTIDGDKDDFFQTEIVTISSTISSLCNTMKSRLTRFLQMNDLGTPPPKKKTHRPRKGKSPQTSFDM